MSSLPSPTPTPTPPAADALEQHDAWRNAWQAFTGNVLLAILSAVVIFALVAGALLPQQPAGGTAEPLAYSQWQTQAREMTGVFYDTAYALGLFGVMQVLWLRAALAILVVAAGLRLAERLARLLQMRRAGDTLQDEERVRVTDNVPILTELAVRLRAQHYRVSASVELAADTPGWLVADRLPWAEVFSIVLHVGLLVAVAGALVNMIFGWGVARQQIGADASATSFRGNLALQLQAVDSTAQTANVQVQGETQSLVLPVGRTANLPWVRALPVPCCLALRLDEITPGYRVSAAGPGGVPLTITVSSYADPAREALLTFRRDEPERLVAIEEARMAVLVSEDAGGSVQVYGVPSGQILTDTVIRPSIVVSDTTLVFKPATSAVVSAYYRPGDGGLLIGGVLALIGFIVTMLWPMQRLVVRHYGHWTEVYASGSRVRRVVRELLSIQNMTPPPAPPLIGEGSTSPTTASPANGEENVSHPSTNINP